jgi:sulfide:quinone oxidoreductase
MKRHVVIAGAGVAGLETALALHHLAPDLVSVELIAPDTQFVYRPLSVAEPFGIGEMRRFPLGSLVAATGAKLRHATVVAVEPEEKHVALEDESVVDYDALVLALGARTVEAIPGALAFDGRGNEAALARLLERARVGEVSRIVFAVPSSTTWPLPLYELALLTAEHLTDNVAGGWQITLVTPEDRPLGLFGPEASDAIAELLGIRSIAVETGAVPLGFGGGTLHCRSC